MCRREFVSLPALGLLPAAADRPASVHCVRLSGPEPLTQLVRVWRYGAVRRMVVRPEPAWWPAPAALPDRWQAWIDLGDGGAVHVVAQGESTGWPAHPVAVELVRLLTVGGS